MGKSILELFQNAKAGELQPLPGVPLEIKGKTPAERYDIKNSKDINLRVASPLMNFPLYALNQIRIGTGDKDKESFLEEELIGLRALRGLASPIIYGSDIIRLKLLSTPTVEKMKQSAAGTDSSALTKFGQKIKETRDAANKFLGIPKPLNPTEYYRKLKDYTLEPWENAGSKQDVYIPVYDTMDVIDKIKKEKNGTELGKILKQSAGGGSAIGKQVLGAGLAKAKSELRKKVLGTNAPSLNGNNNFQRNQFLYSQAFGENYSQLEIGAEKTGKANEDVDYIPWGLKSRYDGVSSTNPRFPIITNTEGTGWNSTFWYSSKLENPVSYDPRDKKNGLFAQYYNPDKTLYGGDSVRVYSYTKNENAPNTRINAASKLFETQPYNKANFWNSEGPKDEILVKIRGGEQKKIDIKNLRPSPLAYKELEAGEKKPSYSKQKGGFVNTSAAGKTLYGNLSETREARGFGSNHDVINQTGVLTQEEFQNTLVGDKTLEKIDFIPLRFQKVNNNTGVYMRAAITSFQETFNPYWEGKQMLGNPFKFYTYTAVERKVGFTMKVYALSQVELIMMWKRLEFLAKLTYPHGYTSNGVEPSLLYFTLGSLYVDKPAIITTLTFSIDDNQQLWEIGGTEAKIRKDKYTSVFNNKFLTPSGFLSVDTKNSTKYVSPQKKFEYIEQNQAQLALENNSPRNFELDESTAQNTTRTKIDGIEYNNVKVGETNIDMNMYKLPKVISVQIELTFLESQNEVDSMYAFGTPITKGKYYTPPPPSQNNDTKTEKDNPPAENLVMKNAGDQSTNLVERNKANPAFGLPNQAELDKAAKDAKDKEDARKKYVSGFAKPLNTSGVAASDNRVSTYSNSGGFGIYSQYSAGN